MSSTPVLNSMLLMIGVMRSSRDSILGWKLGRRPMRRTPVEKKGLASNRIGTARSAKLIRSEPRGGTGGPFWQWLSITVTWSAHCDFVSSAAELLIKQTGAGLTIHEPAAYYGAVVCL